MHGKLFLLSLTVLIFAGCRREVAWEPDVVARVGDRILNAGEVDAWEASLKQADVMPEARSTYIRQWVENELLSRDAIDRGLLKDPWILQRLDEIKRQLLISRLLDQKYQEMSKPSSQAIEAYFRQHSSEFIWPHLHLEVEYWRSSDRVGIEQLRSNVQRGRQTGVWSGEASTLEHGTITLDGPGSAAPQIWSAVCGMSPGEVSPVRFAVNEYWVFKLSDRRESGEQQGIEDVKEEISMRLMEEARRHIRSELLRELVDQYRSSGQLFWSIQRDLDSEIQGDSLRISMEEER